MNKPMTVEEWVEAQDFIGAMSEKQWKDARLLWNAALATVPHWHKWSDEQPQLDNEFGSKLVLIEHGQNPAVSRGSWTVAYITDLPGIFPGSWGHPPLAWQYIVPSGFKMVEKSKAELAWEKWVAYKCPTVAGIPVSRIGDITKESFIELYEFNLGAETKGGGE
jgi:hypothetical protein